MAQPNRHGRPGSDSTDNEEYYRCYDGTTKLATLFKDIKEPADLAKLLDCGITDIWLPIPSEILPPDLDPGATSRLQLGQSTQLEDRFDVNAAVHCNLSSRALDTKQKFPTSLVFQRTLGKNQRKKSYVAAVTHVSNAGGVYALKRIKRKVTTFLEAHEQMRYIQAELAVLRRIDHFHCIQFVASYTEIESIGILMRPVADHNLEQYLDEFDQKSGDRYELASFFGCLASTLAALHYKFGIRHKDIKPQNILVKEGNVMFTDFEIALDWSNTNHTTTQQETMRSPKYCAPETASDTQTRNTRTDIWSLGCVFLEMVTVLKGLPRSAVENELQRQPFHRNKQGIDRFMAELEKRQSKCNNVPLEWIAKMLQEKNEERPNAKQLKDMVLKPTATTGRLVFCGICCIDGEGPQNDGHETQSKPQEEVVGPPAEPIEPEHDEISQYGSTTSGSRGDTTGSGQWTLSTLGLTSEEGTNSLPLKPPRPPISPSLAPATLPASLPLRLGTQATEVNPPPPPRYLLSVFEHGTQDTPNQKEWHELEVTVHPDTAKNWNSPATEEKLRMRNQKHSGIFIAQEPPDTIASGSNGQQNGVSAEKQVTSPFSSWPDNQNAIEDFPDPINDPRVSSLSETQSRDNKKGDPMISNTGVAQEKSQSDEPGSKMAHLGNISTHSLVALRESDSMAEFESIPRSEPKENSEDGAWDDFHSDVESVLETLFSSDGSVLSSIQESSNGIMRDSTELLVHFFSNHPDLTPLYQIASRKVGSGKLKDQLRGFFKEYGKNLQSEAANNSQKKAAQLVSTMARHIAVEICQPEILETLEEPHISKEDDIADKKRRVNQWMDDQSTAKWRREPAVEEDDENTDEELNEFDKPDQHSFDDFWCDDIERFMETARAFQELQRRLKTWLKLNKSNEREKESTGSVKSLSGRLLEYTICVLSAPFREPAIPPGKTRIRWNCSCGQQLYDDFVELKPGGLAALRNYLQAYDGTGMETGEASSTRRLFPRFVAGICSTISLQAQESLRRAKGLWRRTYDPGLPLQNVNSRLNTQTQDALQLCICINKGVNFPKLHESQLGNVKNDQQLFDFLRKEYYSHRKLPPWATMKHATLSLCRFNADINRLVEAHRHQKRCPGPTGHCECLPPKERVETKEYQCSPVPGIPAQWEPAISPQMLTHYFKTPNHPQHTPAKCNILLQLPKRTRPLPLSPVDTEQGWGVYFEEVWHWPTICVVTGVLFVIAGIAFGIAWSIVKGDISSAFTVAATWIAIAPFVLGLILASESLRE